jgi:putative endonuclease
MYYVYILKSIKDGNKYIGCTNNLKRRLQQHNDGKCTATKNRRPFKIIYTETYEDKNFAYAKEGFFKTGKGREYIKDTLRL